MGTKLGLDCKLYRGDAGATANVEMTNVTNVTLSLSKGEADITTRAAQGWKMTAATLKEASIEFEMLYDPEDADFIAVQAAFLNGTPLAIFVSDGSGNGLDCDCDVTGFDIDQSLEEAVKVSVTLKPTNIGGQTGRAPAWKTTSGGATSGGVTSGGGVGN